MLRKIIGLTLLFCSVLSSVVVGQNAIVGTGFAPGWGGGSCPTGNGNFEYMSSSAGTSFIATRNANGTGLQFFRFGIDFSGTTAQRTITIGSDVDITPSQTYNLNSGCTTSGSMRLNVSNTAHNYVFKTLNAGTNPTGTFVVFEVQGTVQTVSSVTQAPANNAVLPGSNVVITANLSGALSSGQNVYLRYTSNNYTNSTVVAMTGSGTTYTTSIPAGTNTAGANVSYYVFTSGPSNVATDGSNADLYTINLNNNAGANYTYTVLSPSFIYNYTNATTGAPASVGANATGSNLTRVNGTTVPGTPCGTGFSTQGFSASTTYATTEGAVEFQLTPNSGFLAAVSAISVDLRRSPAGPVNVRLAYSLDGGGTWIDRGTNEAPNNAGCGTTNAASWTVSFNANSGNGVRVRAFGFNSGTGLLQILNFQLTGIIVPVAGPSAAVESPVGTTIANGGSRASIGNIIVGVSTDFQVRIRNLGGTNTLTVNSINFGGANSGDFSLVTPPAFPFNVTPGAFQDLTVRVAPGAVGARAATMTVASNDVSGNASYVINLSATGTASNTSDIIDNTTYSGASPNFNINTQYINFVNTTQNSNDKPVVMKFMIRDGGAGAPDADNLPTSLTAISFTVRNTSGVDRSNFIQTAVLTTELGTVLNLTPPIITGGEIQFTGLSAAAFTVPDNGASASNLHLRVSFVAANVIDNEKLVYQVSSATASTSGSQFFNASAGAARTDNLTTNDQNRIEVIATRFAFVQQPTNTGFGQTMTPNPSVEAQDANSRRDLDFITAISLTSTGTMTGSPISVDASAGLAIFTSVIHTVQQTGRQLTAGNGSLTAGLSNLFDINASSGTTDFFRTASGFTTGNWNATGSWESSPDNATWVAASVVPNSTASGITLRSGTLTITADASARLLTVQTGAILVHNNGAVFTIAADGTAATDFLVQGRYSLNGRQPVLNIGATAVIASGAEVWGVTNGTPGESDDFARNTAVTWQNNSVFSWNTVNAFETSGTTYFSGTPAAVIPIFRIQANTSVGAGSATTINGVVEMAATYTSTWNAAGAKEFRNGIIGSGTLTQAADCGQFRITGTTSQLGSGSGPLTLNLRNDVSSGLALQAGTCTMLGNVTSNTGPMYVDAGATLIAGTYVISGSSSFTLNSNATLSSAHANGVNGNITVSGTPTFADGSNYIFNGTVNQVTGTRMADVVGSLSINNSGTASNNFVTLTDNNTTATTFNMQAGIFRAGSGNTLRIAAGGTVNGSGGHVSTDVNGEGGTIQMLGAGNITGTPRLWIVAIGNSGTGVTFTNNAPIYHQCIIGSNGFVTNAPTYQSGSTLIYRTNGTFARNVEWGNTAGLPGYPHHVTVDGNTIVDLFTNGITPATLAIGGNLQLGSSNGYGRMYLNNNMNKPLEVLGDVTIGNGDLAATTSVLALEDSQPGGDLILHGNFTRHSGSVFIGYNRAVFLRGSNNSSIRVLPQPPASSGTSIDEIFPYVFIQKSNPDAEITMNCTVGVNDQLDLTGNGLITSTTGNYLVIINKNSNAIIGGSATSFVNGPLIRRTANTASNYHYPVGKKTGTGRVYRPLRFSTMNNLGNGDEFTGEYFSFTDATPSAGQDVLFGSTIGGILKNEYWQFDRIPSSFATGKLAITYQFSGTTGEWRDAAGNDSPPCADCNVAVVKRTTNAGNPGNWNFTKTDNNFDDISTDFPEARYYSNNGFIQTGELNSYGPFTIGFNFNTILGTLPVKLLAFNGSMQQQKANLQWQIDSDKDVQHFELQHSTNGTAFTTVHTLLPAGNTYSSTHLVSMPGRHFYRLKVKEKNGRSFYSKVVVLVAGNSATFISGMQSTVVSQQAVVNLWSQQNQTAQTSLYDASGKLLAQQQQQLLRGDNQLKVAAQQLPQGVYFLQVQTADGVRQTLRWLKQ